MKKILYTAAVFAAACMISSCEKHEIAFYDGVDAIFFDQQFKGAANEAWLDTTRLAHQNYTFVNFNTILGMDSVLSIKIETTGYLRDYPRPFKVEIVADSTTAVPEEYEILNPDLAIEPGQNSTHLKVKLKMSDRMYDETVKLQLRIVPGEHFVLPFGEKGIGKMPLRYDGNEVATDFGKNTDPSVHNIFVNKLLSQPKLWPIMPGHIYYLGVWSSKKYALILDLCGEKFGWNTWHFDNQMPMERLGIVNRLIRSYLTEQFKLGRDHYVLEEDGTLMWVKGCSWSEGITPDELSGN